MQKYLILQLLRKPVVKYQVDWPLIAMDCPDCASKAMRGLSHLKQVIDPEISVTSGDIKLTVDLDQGSCLKFLLL